MLICLVKGKKHEVLDSLNGSCFYRSSLNLSISIEKYKKKSKKVNFKNHTILKKRKYQIFIYIKTSFSINFVNYSN